MGESLNVLDEPLEPCGNDPVTGFFRDGCCNTSDQDRGSHTVCAVLTEEFLEFSRARGNDLVTPRLEFVFRGSQRAIAGVFVPAAGPRPSNMALRHRSIFVRPIDGR